MTNWFNWEQLLIAVYCSYMRQYAASKTLYALFNELLGEPFLLRSLSPVRATAFSFFIAWFLGFLCSSPVLKYYYLSCVFFRSVFLFSWVRLSRCWCLEFFAFGSFCIVQFFGLVVAQLWCVNTFAPCAMNAFMQFAPNNTEASSSSQQLHFPWRFVSIICAAYILLLLCHSFVRVFC